LKNEYDIPIKGVGIGNGFSDPVVQVLSYADISFNFGLVDKAQKEELEKIQKECVEFTKTEQWIEASSARDSIFAFIRKVAGRPNLFDVTGHIYIAFYLSRKLERS